VRRLAAAAASLALVLAGAPAPAAGTCARRPAAAARLGDLRAALAGARFVAYQPTGIEMHDGRPTRASEASIRADLAVLRPKFDALATYGALNGAEAVPRIASELGFRALVIGVWDPADPAEVASALDAAARFPKLVVGVSLGNERLFAGRGDAAALVAAVRRVRATRPSLPLGTTEPFHMYYRPALAPLLGELDFVLANVHPVFQPWWREAPDANGADFVAAVLGELAARYCGPVLVKETGVPTAPAEAGFSEARQASFYRALRARLPPTPQAAFAYFAAFDAPWRVADEQAAPGHHPEEAHWGLFDSARRPKPAATEIPALPARR
jgi:exo-beta-1,3-glucanase (GH17 family)